MRNVTRLAPCSLGEAEPAKITSASTETRGLLLVGIGLGVVTLALLSQPGEQLLGGQPGFQTETFDLLRQLRYKTHHPREDEYAIQINQAERVAFLDVDLLSQLGWQRDDASLAHLNWGQRPLGFRAAHYGLEICAAGRE